MSRSRMTPLGRIDWMREVMGGDLTPEFMEAVMLAGDAQRQQYGPDGRGAIKVAAGGAWTNIGPDRSNWIQNGLQVQERIPARADVLRASNESRRGVRADIERRTVEDDQFQRSAPRVGTEQPIHELFASAAVGGVGQDLSGTVDPRSGLAAHSASAHGGQTGRRNKLGISTVVPDVRLIRAARPPDALAKWQDCCREPC